MEIVCKVPLDIWVAFTAMLFDMVEMKHEGPAFICVGEQRCGTTWLYRALAKHPEIWLPPIKATRYFIRDDDTSLFTRIITGRHRQPLRRLKRWIRDGRLNVRTMGWFFRYYFGERNAAWYQSLMRPPAGLISGEICHGYSGMSLSQLEMMRDAYPHAKLIFMIRNPIERSWSGLARNLAARRQPPLDADRTTEELLELLGTRGAIRKSHYIDAITRILKVFPREQLFIGYFDQLQDNPAGFLLDLTEWLDIERYDVAVGDPPGPVGGAKYPSIPSETKQLMSLRLFESTQRLYEKFPSPYSFAWLKELEETQSSSTVN